MRNFTWNRFPIKNLLIDSLLTPIVESTYLRFLVVYGQVERTSHQTFLQCLSRYACIVATTRRAAYNGWSISINAFFCCVTTGKGIVYTWFGSINGSWFTVNRSNEWRYVCIMKEKWISGDRSYALLCLRARPHGLVWVRTEIHFQYSNCLQKTWGNTCWKYRRSGQR